MPTLEFSEKEATRHRAVVVSFDLAGFSNFCNQPDAPTIAPRLIKHLFDLFNEMLSGTEQSEFESKLIEDGKLLKPRWIKFTGDGALVAWILPANENFSQEFCNLVIATMRQFQCRYAKQVPMWEKEWRVHRLPKRMRVGIASGMVYALRPPHLFTSFTDAVDYVGYCINLAVRLQSHCPEIGFIVHRVLNPELPDFVEFEAIKMKGTQVEPVLVFEEDLSNTTETLLAKKFR